MHDALTFFGRHDWFYYFSTRCTIPDDMIFFCMRCNRTFEYLRGEGNLSLFPPAQPGLSIQVAAHALRQGGLKVVLQLDFRVALLVGSCLFLGFLCFLVGITLQQNCAINAHRM
jgi:hypothetical protein